MFKSLPELVIPQAQTLELERAKRRQTDCDQHACCSVAVDNLRKWLETGKGNKFRCWLPHAAQQLFRETYEEKLEEQGYRLWFEGHNVYVLAESQ